MFVMNSVKNQCVKFGQLSSTAIKNKANELLNTENKLKKVGLGILLFPTATLMADYSIKAAVKLGYLTQESIKHFIEFTPEMLPPCQMPVIARIFVLAVSAPLFTVVTPFIEELLCREILQKEFFGNKMQLLLNKISPQMEKIWKGPVGEISKICLASVCFALPHMLNDQGMFKGEGLTYVCASLGYGLALGAIFRKEGFFASFGAHAGSNFYALMTRLFFGCISK